VVLHPAASPDRTSTTAGSSTQVRVPSRSAGLTFPPGVGVFRLRADLAYAPAGDRLVS